jgi:hypothetical protein
MQISSMMGNVALNEQIVGFNYAWHSGLTCHHNRSGWVMKSASATGFPTTVASAWCDFQQAHLGSVNSAPIFDFVPGVSTPKTNASAAIPTNVLVTVN